MALGDMLMQLTDAALFRTENYVNGQWVAGSGGTLEVINPANGAVVAVVANGSAENCEQAVEAAAAAFDSWSALPAKERSACLRRWHELIVERADDLGSLMTAEQGKPLAEAIGEVKYGAAFVEYYAEECKRVSGHTIPTIAADRRLQTYRQPVGVVGCITPWNFPSAMITRKAAPALAAGCTVVFRPACETPLSALALCELAHRAGIPAGVFNVVVGDDSEALGKVLTQHPKVGKFTFTGSTSVGRTLMAQCASTVKKVSLELGGNAPFIVFEDADIDVAVADCVATKFRNCGQTCVCTNRIYVHHSIATEFTQKLKTAITQLSMGEGFGEGVTTGPLISERAVANMEALMADSLDKGAELLLGVDAMNWVTTSFSQP